MFKPSSNFRTGRSKAMPLLWIIFICVSCLSLPYCLICSMQPCGPLLGKGRPLSSLVHDVLMCFIAFLYGVLGQVWNLIVSILDLCLLPYFMFLIIYGWNTK